MSTMSETTSSRTILLDSDTSWNRVPYQVVFGETFTTMADSLRYLSDTNADKTYQDTIRGSSDQELAEVLGAPSYIGQPNFRDTRLGANDAMNCIWQFNRDDDIVHEMMRSDPQDKEMGMGTVYAATVEQNQSLAYFTFGVPRYTSLTSFYTNAFNKELIKMNNTGFSSYRFARLFGELGVLAFTLPILPLKWLGNLISIFADYPVSRFYDLRPTMHLYYRYVDSILSEWLVNTGIYGNNSEGQKNGVMQYIASEDSLPIAIKETGVSIWDIMSRKAYMLGLRKSRDPDDQDFANEINRLTSMSPEDYDNDSTNVWGGDGVDWSTVVANSAMGATQFIAFRIEKSTGSSESFSNSTSTSPLADQINSSVRAKQTAAMDKGMKGGSHTGIDIIDGLIDGAKSAIESAAGWIGMDGMAAAATSGAFIDIPEQYTDSSFSKSHSITLQLRSPYGSISSIYSAIMVPLACILAGALPRAAGTNSYNSPFLCRVYCKGLFSIPLGIIESISIERGSSEHGWNYQNLPLCVNVSISIKDLSPIMYMAIKDSGFKSLLGANNSFNEYMLTLAGTGLYDRINRWEIWSRNAQLLSHTIRNRTLNPNSWANGIGSSTFARAIGNFSDWSTLSNR